MANYYYTRGNQRFGPVSAEQLQQLAAQGTISPNDSVSTEGSSEWVQAGTLKALFAAVPRQTSNDPLGFLKEATPGISATHPPRTRRPGIPRDDSFLDEFLQSPSGPTAVPQPTAGQSPGHEARSDIAAPEGKGGAALRLAEVVNDSREHNTLDEILGTSASQSLTDSAEPGNESARRPCPNCGEAIVATASQCRFCGAVFDAWLMGSSMRRGQSYQGFAITSMVLGIVGIFAFFIGIVLGIMAVIFGGVALNGMTRSRNNEGKGMAIAGLVLGIIECAGWGIWYLLIIVAVSSAPHILR